MDAKYTGELIAKLRKEQGLTQKQLAAELYVTDKAVSKWERGLNFPELSLMENLAKVLDTTPACLLGLENANQEEIVNSFARISGEQVEETGKYIRRTGWLLLVGALVLFIVYFFLRGRLYTAGFESGVRSLIKLWKSVILAMTVGGIVLVRKFGELKLPENEIVKKTRAGWKKILITALLLIVAIVFYFPDFVVRSYVKTFHHPLEAYAEQLLEETEEEVESDRYGLWDTNCYTEKNLVEFQTGGSGLVFNSKYWGFYYSPDNTHRAFQGYECDMNIDPYDEDFATWSEEGTDNGGTSLRILENWFWYEAGF